MILNLLNLTKAHFLSEYVIVFIDILIAIVVVNSFNVLHYKLHRNIFFKFQFIKTINCNGVDEYN